MDHPLRRLFFTRFLRGDLGRAVLLLTMRGADARLRRVLLARFLRGDSRRWATYFLLTGIWGVYRRYSRRESELVYRAVLGSSAQFGLATADPLPRRLRSRKLRRSLQAASKADLA